MRSSVDVARWVHQTVPVSTVLVVDDEPKITRLVRDYLDQAGLGVFEAATGREALALVDRERPDLIVLDLGLPDIDGLDVLREIRTTSSVPVIILTARSDETDLVVGLELGADDYVVKPFGTKELVARVRALLRRVQLPDDDDVIRIDDCMIDLPKMQVSVGGSSVEFTATEFELLAKLARQPGRVFTRGQLLEAIHGIAFESYERAIDAHIKNIRRKLEIDPRKPQYLLTVRGIGYKFRDA